MRLEPRAESRKEFERMLLDNGITSLELDPDKEVALCLTFKEIGEEYHFEYYWRNPGPVIMSEEQGLSLKFDFSFDETFKTMVDMDTPSESPAKVMVKRQSKELRKAGWRPAYDVEKVAPAETKLAHALAELVEALGGGKVTVDPNDPSAAVNHTAVKFYNLGKRQAEEITRLKRERTKLESRLKKGEQKILPSGGGVKLKVIKDRLHKFCGNFPDPEKIPDHIRIVRSPDRTFEQDLESERKWLSNAVLLAPEGLAKNDTDYVSVWKPADADEWMEDKKKRLLRALLTEALEKLRYIFSCDADAAELKKIEESIQRIEDDASTAM